MGLFRLARWIHRKRLCILCYHGLAVDGESRFRPKLFMEPTTFASRLASLKRAGIPVLPLGEAAKLLYAGRLPDNAVVITIDDGFYSTYGSAAPALRAHGFPATVYMTTYYALKGTPIYRLFVHYAFWATRSRHLQLSEVAQNLDGDVDLTEVAARDRAIARLVEYGEVRGVEEQEAIAERLGKALEVDYSAVKSKRSLSLMTPSEIRSLREYGIDVQLHTHRHRLPMHRETVLKEIADNRDALAALTTGSLDHLCYPSGEWSSALWPWLHEANIATATTCDYGLNDASTPPLALNRFLDGENVSLIEFEAGICGFAGWLLTIKHWVRRTHSDSTQFTTRSGEP